MSKLQEELFSIMCEVVAMYSIATTDYKAGKITVYEVAPKEQAALMHGRDKASRLFREYEAQSNQSAALDARIEELSSLEAVYHAHKDLTIAQEQTITVLLTRIDHLEAKKQASETASKEKV